MGWILFESLLEMLYLMSRTEDGMNPNTGAIGFFENEKDAKKAGHTVEVPKQEVERVFTMNRAARRAWAKEQRKSGKKK